MIVSGSTEIRQRLEHAEEGILYSVCQSTRCIAGIRYALCEGKGKVFYVTSYVFDIILSYLTASKATASLWLSCLIGSACRFVSCG